MAMRQLRIEVVRRWTGTLREDVKGPPDMSRTLRSGSAIQMMSLSVTVQHAVGSTGSETCASLMSLSVTVQHAVGSTGSETCSMRLFSSGTCWHTPWIDSCSL